MQTSRFLNLLGENESLKLHFEYNTGQFIRPDYHITEVKNVAIEATDCGGRQASWRETVIQLWEDPETSSSQHAITSKKALEILSRVNGLQPLVGDTVLKFEYGNSRFHTSQLLVSGFRLENDHLIISLDPEHTTCKARDLCAPAMEATVPSGACEEGSGCC